MWWTFKILKNVKKNIGDICAFLGFRLVSCWKLFHILGGVVGYLVAIFKDDDLVHAKDCSSTGDACGKLSFEFECLGSIVKLVI